MASSTDRLILHFVTGSKASVFVRKTLELRSSLSEQFYNERIILCVSGKRKMTERSSCGIIPGVKRSIVMDKKKLALEVIKRLAAEYPDAD